MSALELPLHFLRPWWWLALLPLPLILWMLARHGGGRAALARLADAALLPHLVDDRGVRQRLALALVALAWLLAVAALSGPAWQKVETPLYVNGAARVVALSLSDDMLAQDMKPDRMARARFAVQDLLDGAGDARTALVAYAGAAFTVAPLTSDKRTVINFLRALGPDVMPVPGNDAAAGIHRSVALLADAHVKGGQIVLVTDTAGHAAVAAAKTARAQGIQVDVLGVGTTAGAPVPRSSGGFTNESGGLLMARRDDAALRAVAVAGGGQYVVLQPDGSGVAALRAPAARTGTVSRHQRASLWRDGGIWLLPALVVLAAIAFRRGWLLLLVLLVTPLGMPTAHAASWSSWFSNRDQRAAQALVRGDDVRARQLATTPGMRGAADYRAGDYAAASKAFAQGDDARSRYNLGNALAKQGDYTKAIAAYRAALKQDPELADARANLDAVENWLRHHQPPPRPGQRGSQNRSRPQTPGAGARSNPGHGQSSPRSGRAAPSAAGPQSGRNGNGQRGGRGAAQDGHAGPTPGEAEQQNRQTGQARRGLARELQDARKRPGTSAAGRAKPFALGQTQPRSDHGLNGQQRALLRAVPDDPGALLRRKFRLEWAQRQARGQEGGQP